MRQIITKQLKIVDPIINHEHAQELNFIREIISENFELLHLIHNDLIKGLKNPTLGREGQMSAEQVFMALLIKQMNGFSYEQLAFHLEDSKIYRSFCGFGIGDETPSGSTLQRDIKKNSAITLETINQILMRAANDYGIENGNTVRVDCTVVESNIHKPVPSSEKIVSIYEPHTDIIVKDKRETYYGHKIALTGGTSGLLTDLVILDGNPADSTMAEKMIVRQKDVFDKYPKQASFDGGFASKDNLKKIKELSLTDVVFAKKRGLKISDMAKSTWVYKKLRNFRAGIEGMISFLKRSFGLTRCTWKGHESFKAYAWSSVVTANLLLMARRFISSQSKT